MRAEAENAVRRIFESVGGFTVRSSASADKNVDLLLRVKSDRGADIVIAVEAKARITPQIALQVFKQMQQSSNDRLPVFYAPVVSDRVAEIAKECDVSFIDRAGNCFLRSRNDNLLIERTGFKSEREKTKRIIDLFAPKASRIIRVMLQHPAKGWRVRELASHEDVRVSPGMAQRVKSGLIEEGYAILRDRQLYLRDRLALLAKWKERYEGPSHQVDLYVRGDVAEAEATIAAWCAEHDIQWALGGFSAAWRLAPEVRYSVASVYVEQRAFQPSVLDTLFTSRVKQVDSGANLRVWQAYDESVFANRRSFDELQTTSALQTYLDVSQMAGRGPEAAEAIYEKHLRKALEAAHAENNGA